MCIGRIELTSRQFFGASWVNSKLLSMGKLPTTSTEMIPFDDNLEKCFCTPSYKKNPLESQYTCTHNLSLREAHTVEYLPFISEYLTFSLYKYILTQEARIQTGSLIFTDGKSYSFYWEDWLISSKKKPLQVPLNTSTQLQKLTSSPANNLVNPYKDTYIPSPCRLLAKITPSLLTMAGTAMPTAE